MAIGCCNRLEVRSVVKRTNRSRKYHYIDGAFPRDELAPYDDNIMSLSRALLERLFYIKEDCGFVTPPRAAKGVMAETAALFFRDLKKFLPHMVKITDQEFVDGATGRKRLLYQKAADSLHLKDICYKDAKIKGFQKWQKENHTQKPGAPPRWISPRNYRYIVRLGCYIRPLEKRLYKAFNDLFGCESVSKGASMATQGETLRSHWESFQKPVAVGMDVSRFEQCVGIDALREEHKIYLFCFNNSPELRKLLDWQLVNTGTAECDDGSLWFKIMGSRMSGDMNTGLGNTLLTLMLLYVWAKTCNVKIKPYANGDDANAIMEEQDVGRFMGGCKDWYLKHGFRLKLEKPVDIFERIDFCQAKPVYTDSGYVMVREVNVGISKDTVSLTRFPHARMMRQWLKAVGDGGISLTGGIPIYQEFYSMYIRESRGEKPIKYAVEFEDYKHYKYLGMSRKVQPISERTRYSFWLAFGITPDDQMAIEAYYRDFVIEDFVVDPDDRFPAGNLPWAG